MRRKKFETSPQESDQHFFSRLMIRWICRGPAMPWAGLVLLGLNMTEQCSKPYIATVNWRASAKQCKNLSEYDRRNFPAAKAIRAPTPLLRQIAASTGWSNGHFREVFLKAQARDTFYESYIQKYFLLCNHAAWWTLAIAGFSMSLGREEAVFLWHIVEVFPITVLSRGALCEEYFQWRLICGAKRH